MVRGEVIGCIGLTEPHAGSDLARVRTRARKITGGWKLDGVKQFITNGSTAQVAIILAVTDPDAGTRAMSFFLVPTDTPGFIIGKVEDKLGQNISDTAQIILEQCIIPDDDVMGEPHMALPATMGLLYDGRITDRKSVVMGKRGLVS